MDKQKENELKPFPYFGPGCRLGLGGGGGGGGLCPARRLAGRLLLLLRGVVENHQLHLATHRDRVVRLLQGRGELLVNCWDLGRVTTQDLTLFCFRDNPF